jgi:hypothetical protein
MFHTAMSNMYMFKYVDIVDYGHGDRTQNLSPGSPTHESNTSDTHFNMP